MRDFPLFRCSQWWIAWAVLTVVAIAVHTCLLVAYASASLGSAIADAATNVLVFEVLALMAWPVATYVSFNSLRICYAVLSMLVWLGLGLATWVVCESIWGVCECSFAATVPFRIIVGLLAMFAVFLVYEVEKLLPKQPETDSQLLAQQEVKEHSADCLERITIKDGGKIHIVETAELVYIQAFGDYAKLFTTATTHLKEQTMKDFEAQLSPQRFVRIHRSYIVNVDYISRVELYGKESYRVILKNGTSLNASLSGYRLLKERLGL